MRDLIKSFPKQIKQSIKNGKIEGKLDSSKTIDAIVICGMGGSGIGGKIVSEWLKESIKVPYICHNSYGLPRFCNENTLVIISSYSGNTEETLSAMEQALAKQCQIACITSGGKVQSWSEKYDIPYVKINGGEPPRSQFGQSTVQLCRILHAFGIAEENIFSTLDLAAQKLEANQPEIENKGIEIANHLNQTIPAIYVGSDYEGVAIRWRQQIAENSKMLSFHHQFPEMNHNDLVGWEGADSKYAAVLLRNEDDAERVKVRMDICKGIFEEKKATVVDVESWGENPIEKSLYLVHLGDWVSLHLAEMNKIDPVDIKNIDLLKNKLSELR